MTTVFITGFPGFIASRLMLGLTNLYSNFRFICLVQAKFRPQALVQMQWLDGIQPGFSARIELIEGDITEPFCGLSTADLEELRRTVTEVWHLAAIYDLAVRRDLAYRVNVEGTRHVGALAVSLPALSHFFYISTAFVSGTRTGTIYEDELATGQQFRNFYEETKYLAEVEIRKLRDRIPLTIFRPGIIVGNSATGETQKFDGPYYVLQLMDRLPGNSPFTLLGSGKNHVNLVPVDYVVQSMAWLATKVPCEGKVYHLTDPAPCTQREIAEALASALGKRFWFFPVPAWLAAWLLKIRFISTFLGLPPVLVGYFDHPHRYDCSTTIEDLKGSGITLPSFSDYVPALVSYFQKERTAFKNKQAMY